MPQIKPATILVVDDEEIIRDLLCEILENGGYEVHAAANGREAVEVYRSKAAVIDLVLLDMQMPELDGRQTFGMLRSITPDLRVVMSTGFTRSDIVRTLLDEGVVGVLAKPFHIEELLAVVGKALAPGS